MAKPKRKLGNQSPRHIQRTYKMLESAAYRDLSCEARCLLEEFQRIAWPFDERNGGLSIGVETAVGLLNSTKDRASKAFHDLESHGFIKLRQGAAWRNGMAREYALTIAPLNGKEASDDWESWSKSE